LVCQHNVDEKGKIMSLVTSSPTKLEGPSDALDYATSEIAIGSKLGIDATKKIAGEGFKREWPPLIKMDEAVKAKVESFDFPGSEKAINGSGSPRVEKWIQNPF